MESLTGRVAFGLRIFTAGVSHVGELYQKNLLVGFLALAAMLGYGAIVTAAFIWVGRLLGIALVMLILDAVLIDGAYLETSKTPLAVAVPDEVSETIDALDQLGLRQSFIRAVDTLTATPAAAIQEPELFK